MIRPEAVGSERPPTLAHPNPIGMNGMERHGRLLNRKVFAPPASDDLASQLPSPSHQWTQKSFRSPFQDVSHWMGQGCPRHSWITFQLLDWSQSPTPPFGLVSQTGLADGTVCWRCLRQESSPTVQHAIRRGGQPET